MLTMDDMEKKMFAVVNRNYEIKKLERRLKEISARRKRNGKKISRPRG